MLRFDAYQNNTSNVISAWLRHHVRYGKSRKTICGGLLADLEIKLGMRKFFKTLSYQILVLYLASTTCITLSCGSLILTRKCLTRLNFVNMLQWQLDSWLHGYCGVTTVTNAELQAIYNGLSIAWLEGIRNIICKFDSMCMCLEAHSGGRSN